MAVKSIDVEWDMGDGVTPGAEVRDLVLFPFAMTDQEIRAYAAGVAPDAILARHVFSIGDDQ